MTALYEDENGLSRTILMFSLMMCAHKVEVTWIDEISEALKNCSLGLDTYIIMMTGIPIDS